MAGAALAGPTWMPIWSILQAVEAAAEEAVEAFLPPSLSLLLPPLSQAVRVSAAAAATTAIGRARMGFPLGS